MRGSDTVQVAAIAGVGVRRAAFKSGDTLASNLQQLHTMSVEMFQSSMLAV